MYLLYSVNVQYIQRCDRNKVLFYSIQLSQFWVHIVVMLFCSILEINDVLYSDLWSGRGGSTLVGRGRTLPLRLHTRWRRSPVGRTDRGESGAVVRSHRRNSRLQDITVGLHTSSFGFSTADFPSPFCCILFRHFNHCHVLSHRIHKLPLNSETAMYDQSAASFCARSGQNRSGRSLTSCCLLFYSFINSGRTAKHAA